MGSPGRRILRCWLLNARNSVKFTGATCGTADAQQRGKHVTLTGLAANGKLKTLNAQPYPEPFFLPTLPLCFFHKLSASTQFGGWDPMTPKPSAPVSLPACGCSGYHSMLTKHPGQREKSTESLLVLARFWREFSCILAVREQCMQCSVLIAFWF